MPTYEEGGYVSYTPFTSTTANINTTTYTPITASISALTCNAVEKKEVEALEKHIDELEEDIEFFNNKRAEAEEKIKSLESRIKLLEKDQADLRMKCTAYESQLNYILDKINI